MKNRKGIVMMLMGLLLMLAALFYTFYNFETEREAGETAYSALSVIEQTIIANRPGIVSTTVPAAPGQPAAASATTAPIHAQPTMGQDAADQTGPMRTAAGAVVTVQPAVVQTSPGNTAAARPTPEQPTNAPAVTPAPTGGAMPTLTPGIQLPEVPEYVQFPDMEMPEVEVDGQRYIGVLTIPAIRLQLPIISQWSLPKLKIAPARYMGSAYKDNLILLAHNYSTHFGTLRELAMGDRVTFTDMAGNVFEYEVAEVETLRPTETLKMINSHYPLTLFTCTPGGQLRLTVRCDKVEKTPYQQFSN